MMMIIITSLLDVKVRLVNIYGAFRTYCIIIARFFALTWCRGSDPKSEGCPSRS